MKVKEEGESMGEEREGSGRVCVCERGRRGGIEVKEGEKRRKM